MRPRCFSYVVTKLEFVFSFRDSSLETKRATAPALHSRLLSHKAKAGSLVLNVKMRGIIPSGSSANKVNSQTANRKARRAEAQRQESTISPFKQGLI